jgi:gliding motility-associated-like protein
MKKLLPLTILFLGLSQLLTAQCATCHDGKHDPDKTKNYSKNPTGTGTFTQGYIQEGICGLAYVQGSVFTATRYTPTTGPAPTGFPTTIPIAGMPAGATILKGFLYYGVSYTEATAPPTTATITNPGGTTGTYAAVNTGTSVAVCWGETGTASYKVDVTPNITTNGNYKVNLTGFTNASSEVDGITLIIIYTTPAATWAGSIAIYDGCMADNSGGSMSYTLNGFDVCAASTKADAFTCTGDMQDNVSATHGDTYNGSTGTFPNSFWNFDDISTALPAGTTSVVYTPYTTNTGDCWQWNLAGLYWQNASCTTTGLILTTTFVNPTCITTGSATVSCSTGTAPYTYLWSNGATSSNITGLSVGTYTVTVRDAACNSGTDSVVLVNTAAPTVTSTEIPPTCFGGNNGSSTVTPSGGTPGYTYSWAPVGGAAATATNLTSGSYTCTVTDASGCIAKAIVTVTSPAGMRDSITSTVNATCVNPGSATVGVKGGSAPYTYSWIPTGGTAATGTPLGAGTYTVHVTDKNGCIDSAIATITNPGAPTATIAATNVTCFGGKNGTATVTVKGGTAPYTYSWSSGQTTATINGVGAGTYTCTVTDKTGCSVTVTVTITQPAGETDSIVSTTNVSCFGLSDGSIVVGLTGGAPPLTYAWTPSGGNTLTGTNLSAGTYTLSITNVNGCVQKISGTVTQPTQIVPTASASPQTICVGQTTTLSGSATGGTTPYTYTWNGTATNANDVVSPTVNTTYTFMVTDANGCNSSQVLVTVDVNPAPTALFAPNTTQGCYPLCVSFTDASTPAGTITHWYWQFGNGDTSTFQNPMECYNTAGTFSVNLSVATASGCLAILKMPNLITAYDHPHAAFAATPQPADILQPQIQFTDKTVDYYGLQSWFWTFGDATDSTSSMQNPSHTYGDTGTYCPTLVVTNIHQCSDSIEQCIVIDPHFTLYIPNAFTPNGNGRNDIFLPTGVYVCSFEMWIFDRWGMLMYHTKDMTKGWDGTVNSGRVAQTDTYEYVIEATDCLKHTKHSYLGSVTLIK